MASVLKWVDRPVPCFCLILLGSLVLSLSAALAMKADIKPEQLDKDELEYYTISGQIADGSYEFYPRRTVGYLLVLGALRRAFEGRLVPIQLAISAIFSLTAPLAYLLARRELRDNQAAMLAGLGVMTWPLFVRYGDFLTARQLSCHCSLDSCWRCLATGRRTTGKRAAGSGQDWSSASACTAGRCICCTARLQPLLLTGEAEAGGPVWHAPRSWRPAASRLSHRGLFS